MFWAIYVFAVLIMGFRYKVGMDTYNYMDAYQNIPTLDKIDYLNIFTYAYQPFYLLLNSFCKTFISNEFYPVQLIQAIVVNWVIFRFIYQKSSKPFIALFFYFFIYFLYFNTEVMKESLAVVFFVLNYDNFVAKKWKKYYLLVFISSMFHLSALSLIFLPFLSNLKINTSFCVFLIIFVFLWSIFDQYLGYLDNFEFFSGKLKGYVEFAESGKRSDAWKMLILIQSFLLPLGGFLIAKFILRSPTALRYEPLMAVLIILGAGVVINPLIFSRLTNYYTPIYALLLSEIFISLLHKTRLKIFIISYLLAVFTIYLYDFWSYSKYVIWIPYHSVLDPVDEKDRAYFRYKNFGR